MSNDQEFLQKAIALAFDNVELGGRPFGAVVVKDKKIIAIGVNRLQADCDPTAHAELLALRAAGKVLQSPRLDDCSVYASGQPCPMCFAAMRMSGVNKIVFAYSNEEAEPFGLSTEEIASELTKPVTEQTGVQFQHCSPDDDAALYRRWQEKKK